MHCYNNLQNDSKNTFRIRLFYLMILLGINIYSTTIISLDLYKWYAIVIITCNFVSILLSIIHLWYIIRYDKSSLDNEFLLVKVESLPNIVILAMTILYPILLSKGTNETGKFIICEFILFIGYSLVVIFILLLILFLIFINVFECILSTIKAIDDRNTVKLKPSETEIMLDERGLF